MNSEISILEHLSGGITIQNEVTKNVVYYDNKADPECIRALDAICCGDNMDGWGGLSKPEEYISPEKFPFEGCRSWNEEELENYLSEHFPKKLKSERKRLRLTQAELAKKLNVSRSTVEKWEQGVKTPAPLTREGVLAQLKEPVILKDEPKEELKNLITDISKKIDRLREILEREFA